jgi:hypothetical protein
MKMPRGGVVAAIGVLRLRIRKKRECCGQDDATKRSICVPALNGGLTCFAAYGAKPTLAPSPWLTAHSCFPTPA